MDYEQTLRYWQQLVDVRFKLLALVPTLSAAGVGAFGSRGSIESAAVGILALVAIYGVVMYDVRNSMLHDLAVHRLRVLEPLLGLTRTTLRDWDRKLGSFKPAKSERGGVFEDRRGAATLRLFGLWAWHDHALRLIYAISAAGWVVVVTRGLYETLVERNPPDLTRALVFGGAGAIAFLVVYLELARYEGAREGLRNKALEAPT